MIVKISQNFVREADGSGILEFFMNSEQNSAHIDKHRPCICISYIVCPPYLIKVDMCFDEPQLTASIADTHIYLTHHYGRKSQILSKNYKAFLHFKSAKICFKYILMFNQINPGAYFVSKNTPIEALNKSLLIQDEKKEIMIFGQILRIPVIVVHSAPKYLL